MRSNINKLAKRNDTHLLRKAWHISFGSICLWVYQAFNLEISFWGYFALSAAAFGFLIDLARLNSEKINSIVLKFMGPLMRNSEKDSYSGLPFYALGVGLSILFYSEKIAVLSIMFLVFADPIASYVGINFGKDKILPNKSLQGSACAFVVCNFITIFYLYSNSISEGALIGFSIIAGLIGALSELASAFNIDDNLTIPVLSGAGLTVLNNFLNIIN